MADPDTLEVLKDIRAALNVLAAEKREQLLSELETVSPTRKKMWRLFNGKRTLSEIATAVRASKQAVQQFADECHRSGLIDFEKPEEGGGVCPKRIP